MLIAPLIIIGVIIAVTIFFSPRHGMVLLWFADWLYPMGLLQGVLPLDIRFNQLLLVWLAISALRVAPPDLFSQKTVQISLAWLFINVLGCAAGMLTGPGYIARAVVKEIAKASCPLLVSIAMCTVAREEREMRRQIRWVLIASLAFSFLTILQVKAPHLTRAFEVPSETFTRSIAERMETQEEEFRRSGGLVGASIALTASTVALLCLREIVYLPTLKDKFWNAAVMAINVLALGYSVTRGAIAGLAFAVLSGLAIFRKRALSFAIVIVGFVSVLTMTDLAARLMHRVSSTGSGQADVLAGSASGRAELWWLYLRQWSPHYLLFGRGWTAEFVRHVAAAHNSYISQLACTGLFGCIVTVIIIVAIMRMSRRLSDTDPSPFFVALGEAMILTQIMMLVYGIATDLNSHTHMLLFAMLAIIERRLQYLDSEAGWAERAAAAGAAGQAYGYPTAGYVDPRYLQAWQAYCVAYAQQAQPAQQALPGGPAASQTGPVAGDSTSSRPPDPGLAGASP